MADLKNKDEMTPGGIAEAGAMTKVHTGSWRTYVPIMDWDKCIHCMLCWIVCPDSAIETKDGKKTGTDLYHCKGCGVCATECPKDAITMRLESEVVEEEQKKG
jgi:pyruvate ferredoxin oxidoreductase delta subunit